MGKVDGDVAIDVPPQVHMSSISITHGIAAISGSFVIIVSCTRDMNCIELLALDQDIMYVSTSRVLGHSSALLLTAFPDSLRLRL